MNRLLLAAICASCAEPTTILEWNADRLRRRTLALGVDNGLGIRVAPRYACAP